MPRSYRFDHFTMGHPAPRPSTHGLSLHLQPVSDTQVHYGGQHTETEHLYHAREMLRLLEALTRSRKPAKRTAKGKGRRKAAPRAKRRVLH